MSISHSYLTDLSIRLRAVCRVFWSWHATGTVGFTQQNAWIQNATLRDNITFGRPFERRRYTAVLHACALEPDLAQLSASDMTEIGQNGVFASFSLFESLSLVIQVSDSND
jgi:hypothetical protein